MDDSEKKEWFMSYAFYAHMTRMDPTKLTNRIFTYFIANKTKIWFIDLEINMKEYGL